LRNWTRRIGLALAGVAACIAAAAGTARALTFAEYDVPANSYSDPGYLTAGPDGNVWFSDDGCSGYSGSCAIGRITPSGAITEFQDSRLQGGAVPNGIVTGPDCNLWFAEDSPGAIGRITPSGSITDFTAGLESGSNPYGGIAVGPDGNLWFVDDGSTPAIGRITPSGTITEFSEGLLGGAKPIDIVAGSDGNLWFTDDGYPHAAIGRITTSGAITEFTNGLLDGSSPQHIAEGADGNVWFSDQGETRAIGKVTPSGVITEYARPQGSGPWMLTPGPDGNVWFSDPGSPPAIGEITSSGAVTEYSNLPNGGLPSGITWGPDGNIWFADYQNHAIGRALVGGAPAKTACAAGGSSGSGGSSGAGGSSGKSGSSGTPPKLTLSGLRESHRAWREPGKASRHAPPVGTSFSFTLNAAAPVQFTFTRRAPGRVVKKRCVAPTRRNRHDRSCSRTVAVATWTTAGRTGVNTLPFSGRVGRSMLKPGSYTVLIKAMSKSAHSATEQLRFTIVR
jgi:virginiamycin B lyase